MPPQAGAAAAWPAMLAMTVASLLLTANEAIIKWLTAELPFGQLMSLRSGLSLVVMLPLLLRVGRGTAAGSGDWPYLLARSVALTVSVFLFLWGLSLLPLADNMALAFTAPLFATLFGAWFLREAVGPWRWLALAVGFAGVLLITAPGGRLDWIALLPICAAICLALSDIATRRLMRRAQGATVLLHTHAFIAVAGLATLLRGDWLWPSLAEAAWLAAASLLFSTGLLLQIFALRRAAVSTLAPLRYLALAFAVLLGWLVWGQLPGWGAFAGIVLIAASGVLVWHADAQKIRLFREKL